MLPWWATDFQWTPRWSDDEQQACMRGWFMAAPTFLATYVPTLFVLNWLPLDHSVVALLGLAICGYPTLYLAGRLSERMWPVLSHRAAENAKTRQTTVNP